MNQPTLSDNTPESSLIDVIIAAVNGYLPKVTGRKAALAMEEKVREGWWPGWAPLGYDNVNEGTKDRPDNVVRVDPLAGPLVRQMFERYAGGTYSLWRLAEEMNGRGLRSKGGRRMTVATVQCRLRNPFYYGMLPYKGQLHRGKHEPLISEPLFMKVQHVLEEHDRRDDCSRKHDFLLRGYVHCGICGARLTAEVRPSKGVAYYHCALTKDRHSNRGQNVPVRVLEDKVADLFRVIEFPEKFVDASIARAREILGETRATVDEERRVLLLGQSKLEEQRRRLEEKLLEGVLDDETYRRLAADLKGKIEGIKLKVAELEADREDHMEVFERLLGLTRNIHKAYLEAPPPLKRKYLNIFWEHIEVKDGKIVKAIPTQALQALFVSPNVLENGVRTELNWRPLSQSVRTLFGTPNYWQALCGLLNEEKGEVFSVSLAA